MKTVRPMDKYTTLPLTQKVVNPDGMPTKLLARLLELTSILPVANLEQLIVATQHHYLRPKNLERWQLTPMHFGEHEEEILSLLKQLGFIDEIGASTTTYEAALVLGATVTSMRERIAFLVKEWQRGIRFLSIVGLTGHRSRFLDQESETILFNKQNAILPLKGDALLPEILPENELEIMKFLFVHSELPHEWSQVRVIFVDARKGLGSDPSNKRITTLDTIQAWIKDFQPKPGRYLVVSSQPYVIYQDVVVNSVLPASFQIDTIGPKESANPLSIQNALDALARALYQNYQKIL